VFFMEEHLVSNASLTLKLVTVYAVYLAVGNLIWEIAQLPLYGIWREAAAYEIAYAVFHCTIGDVMIGLVSLVLAALLVTPFRQKRAINLAMFGAATIFGITYTIFSEWLNVYVRQSWSYSELMPTVGWGEIWIGVSPLAQWVLLPPLFFLSYHALVLKRRR